MPLLTIAVVIVGIILMAAIVAFTNRRLSDIEHLVHERVYPIFSHDEIHEQEHEVGVLQIKIQDIERGSTKTSKDELQSLRAEYDDELDALYKMQDINVKVTNGLLAMSEARKEWHQFIEMQETRNLSKINA